MTIGIWTTNPQNTKHINKWGALDLIRFTPGGISRAELATQMDLSRAAVTLIVNDLLENKVIREAESRNSQNGRPPIILEVNPNRGRVVGIDMGASHLTLMLANFSAQIIEEVEVPFNISEGPEKSIAFVEKTLKELLSRAGESIKNISAIGIGVPGPIVSEDGFVLAPPIMPGWDRFPIRDTLEKLWGVPVALNNDAELGALGEWAYGAGRGEKDLAYIKVGSGIGAGLLIAGKIYQGATGSAGEIGHITIDENGPLCKCGNSGCLEAMAGGHAIANQAKDAVKRGERTLLSSITPVENITAREVAAAARRGDLIAQKILSQAGEHLGVAIAGLVNLFNPHMVVVGGGISQVGDLFLQPVRAAVQRRSLPASARTVKISTAVLRQRSTGIGAVVQALSIAMHQVTDSKEVRSSTNR